MNKKEAVKVFEKLINELYQTEIFVIYTKKKLKNILKN